MVLYFELSYRVGTLRSLLVDKLVELHDIHRLDEFVHTTQLHDIEV